MNEASWPEDIIADSGCRLPLADRDSLDDDGKQRYDRISAGKDGALAGLRGPTGLSFHSPEAAKPGQALNMYLRFEAEIPAPTREVAILTVAREMDCAFEWAAHEPQALKDGVPQSVIDTIKQRGPIGDIADSFATLIEFGREVLSNHRVTPETFARLRSEYSNKQIMDLILLLGNYTSLAVLLLAVDQQLPPGDQAALPLPWRDHFPAQAGPSAAKTNGHDDIDRDSGSRLPHVLRDDLDGEAQARYDRITAGLDGVANGLSGPGGLMLHSPVGSRHALALNHYLRGSPVIADDIREVAILSVARQMDCAFEWAAHEPIALKVGVPQDTIDIIKLRGPLDGVSPEHGEVITLGRQVLGDHRVLSDTFSALLRRHDTKTVMDLMLLMGNYTSLAILLIAVDQQLPPGDQATLPLS